VSYASGIRQGLEALLLGTSGTTKTMAAGRFHLASPDRALEDHPVASAERAVRVVLRPGRDIRPANGCDNFVLREHRVLVRIAYVVTHAGGDAAEAAGEQSGAGTLDAVMDRVTTDQHDVESVLCWLPNATSITTPAVFGCQRTEDEPALNEAAGGQLLILELPFTVFVEASTNGTATYYP
jgi:hypothetical protein